MRPNTALIARTVVAATLLLAAIVAPSTVPAQEISLADVLRGAIAQSAELEQANLRTELAASSVDAVLDATRGSFTLAAEPLAGFTTQRGSDFTGLGGAPGSAPATTSLIATSGSSLAWRQPLPTGGLLSAAAGATFSAATAFPDSGDATTTYSLAPSVSLALTQPLFVDGRFLDVEEPRLVLEQARRGEAESVVGAAAVREQVVTGAIRLYAQLGSLLRTAELQETQVELLQLQLNQARIRQEQGQGSRTELFALEVQISRTREAIVQTRLSAREAELELERLIGMEIDLSAGLADLSGPAEVLTAALEATEGSAAATVELERAGLALERARTDLAIARKQERATSSVSLALSPRYADEREAPETLGGSVTDYFGEGGGVDVSLALGVTVALGEADRRARELRQAELALAIAESELERVSAQSATQRQIVLARRAATRERIELIEFELSFDEEQLASELELLELGATTELAVEQLRAGIAQRRNELTELSVQLFLQSVDLARLSGLDPADVIIGSR